MKTFTVRQVRGKASSVLDVCDREGRVQITRTDGKKYIMERVQRRRIDLVEAVKEARREFKERRCRPASSNEILRKILS